jgi:hypothetical protein
VQPDEALNKPGDEVSAGNSEPWPSLARASAEAPPPPGGLSVAGPVTVPRLDLAVAPPGPAPATAPASSDCRRPPATAVRGEPAVSTTAAAAIAARFAADALSWDEDAPGTRAAALSAYGDDGDDGDVGSKTSWDGRGRQRVDLVLPPEEVLRLQSGDILVTLTARVVTYLRTAAIWSDPAVTGGGSASAVPRDAVAPAAAPSPDTPGWAAAQAYWVPISTVVRRTAAGYLAVKLA